MRPIPASCLLLIALTAPGVGRLPAQDADDADLRAVRQRLERIEKELQRLRPGGETGPELKSAGFARRVLPETVHLGVSSSGRSGRQRYLLTRLLFVNLTDRDWTLDRDRLQLKADGQTFSVTEIPKDRRFQSFVAPGNQTIRLQSISILETAAVPAMRTRNVWVYFGGLPVGNHVPSLVVTIAGDARSISIDLNQRSDEDLRLEVERAGPRGSLGILHIGGVIDTINAGTIVRVLSELAAQQVVRAIIHWTDNAESVSMPTRNWLTKAAASIGVQTTIRNSLPYPSIPASLRELHLAGIPGTDSSRRKAASPRIHENLEDAAIAALSSVYERVPLPELIHDVQSDNRMTRVAALAGGGGRLPDKFLPTLVVLTDDEDVAIQRAAIRALKHFGRQQAVDKLLDHVRRNNEPVSSDAIRSLAGSRYAIAHEALLDVLANETPAGRARIVRVLAEYPRPAWAQAMYEYLVAPGTEPIPEVLTALSRMGHPGLVPLLERTLTSTNARLRDLAFDVLAGRSDLDSERIAMDFTLKHLQREAPTATMLRLLNRTRDQRAVPLLIRRFETSRSDTKAILSTLAQIGDQTIAAPIVRRFEQLQDSEQSDALEALAAVGSAEYRHLAGKSLHSKQSSLVRAAAAGLQNDGSPQAVQLLGKALLESGSRTGWQHTASALAMLGTPDALALLHKARESSDSTKRSVVINAIRSAQRRSPGYAYVFQAQQARKQEKWKQAREFYDQALAIDQRLSDAWFGRAAVRLEQRDLRNAIADFERGLAIDPLNSTAVTGRAVALVMDGRIDDGVRFVEQSREHFERDAVYAYNSACVYACALDAVERDDQADDRDQRALRYRNAALSELRRAVERGFRRFDVMQQDEDLKAIHTLPEFKAIVKQVENPDAPESEPPDER